MPQELCPAMGNQGNHIVGAQSEVGDKEQRCKDPVFFISALFQNNQQAGFK